MGRMPSEGQTYNALACKPSHLQRFGWNLLKVENRRDSLKQQINEALQQQIKGEGAQTIALLPIDQGQISGTESR